MIHVEQLTKSYGDFNAVSDLSLKVEKGEIYGFIGLNGAGKTTTIRMLLGMIRPTAGTAQIAGMDVHPKQTEIWKRVGYMVEGPTFYPNLTVAENLEVTRRLRFIDDTKSVDRIMDLLQLTKYRDRKAKNLSLGNTQRLGLAKAMLHQPELLILDDPTNALDPAGIVEIRDLLCDLSFEHGVTVFISSHILGEVARIASRIGILHQGKLVNEVNAEELETQCRQKLMLRTRNSAYTLAYLKELGIETERSENGDLEITRTDILSQPERIVELLVNRGLSPYKIDLQKEDLEAYFLRTITTAAL